MTLDSVDFLSLLFRAEGLTWGYSHMVFMTMCYTHKASSVIQP